MTEKSLKEQAKTCTEICIQCETFQKTKNQINRALACEGARVVDNCLLWKKLEVVEKILREKDKEIKAQKKIMKENAVMIRSLDHERNELEGKVEAYLKWLLSNFHPNLTKINWAEANGEDCAKKFVEVFGLKEGDKK